MKKASEIFEILRQEMHSEDFMRSFRLSTKAFVRERTLTFTTILSFVLNLLRKSIPKELNNFSGQLQVARTTRSAVTQARAKFSSQAFVKLNKTLLKEFYTNNDFKTYHGFIPLAIDGSTVQLPNSSEVIETFGFASNQTEHTMPMARVSMLHDTLNGITLDARIKPYCISEKDIVIEHLEAIKDLQLDLGKILIIFDRGYPSYSLIYYLLENGMFFLIRCGGGFLKEINETVKAGIKDKIQTIPFKRASKDAKEAIARLFPDHLPNEITFRVVVLELKTGEQEVLLTSLMCTETYPLNIFLNLYFSRWNIEEGYKFYKSGVEIENFSGKSVLSVEQDFHATVLATNARALLSLEASREIQKDEENLSRKYEYVVNKKVSMEGLKHDFVKVLLNRGYDIEAFCSRVKSTMKKDRIPIRPGRNFKRVVKHRRRKFHMNQR
ncbi:MAG: IS4 family transposase [Chlamydiales bacterium]|nr:IS4 family transposase [Chlamydiales bacterium]